MNVGIEAINYYGGQAYIGVRSIFENRGLDMQRFDNLMTDRKAVGLPCEDPVTNGVNAAKPIIDQLTDKERNSIELVITSTESALDFGKSLSTYMHDYLNLSNNCRLFELKQACYGGTAAFQMASCFVASQASPGAKALVIATDTARAAGKETYAEPSQASGAIAMLVGDQPKILELDFGANGHHSYEVMDGFRPLPEIETGYPDLSLLSYLDCFKNSYKVYEQKVEGCDFRKTFDYLVCHTPFPGMVKGAHRTMMRQIYGVTPEEIEADFQRRVAPSLAYCVQVGNVYSATIFLALCGLIDSAEFGDFSRVGMFSYGSGCSSEFYSGIITNRSKEMLSKMRIGERLANRHKLQWDEYERLLDLNMEWIFGIKDKEVDISQFAEIYRKQFEGKGLLVLKQIKDFHREYTWS